MLSNKLFCRSVLNVATLFVFVMFNFVCKPLASCLNEILSVNLEERVGRTVFVYTYYFDHWCALVELAWCHSDKLEEWGSMFRIQIAIWLRFGHGVLCNVRLESWMGHEHRSVHEVRSAECSDVFHNAWYIMIKSDYNMNNLVFNTIRSRNLQEKVPKREVTNHAL